MRSALVGIAFLVACGTTVSPAEAVLINRGNGLIYDTALDVTWLQDANYAKTSGADPDGRMFLDEAADWVGSLNYSGYTDWRLPRNSGTVHDGVLFDTQGELASLFLTLGNVSHFPLEKTGPFVNVGADYWLANQPALPPVAPPPLVFDGYAFSNNGGYEYPTVNMNLAGAWAVRSGDVPESIDLVLALPDIVVQSDGFNPTSGTISAFLDLRGAAEANPPEIAAFNVAFELEGAPAGISFGAPQDPATSGLISEGTVFADATELPHTIRFAKDALEPVTATDGGLLVTVPFTVAGGVPSGSYPIRFIMGNELTDPEAQPQLIKVVGGSITVVSDLQPLTGDYNRNGVVDAADYVEWRNKLGQSGTGLAADGNGNGTIDAGDYNVWRANFGHSFSAAGMGAATVAAVPEPTTMLLLLIGAAWAVGARRA